MLASFPGSTSHLFFARSKISDSTSQLFFARSKISDSTSQLFFARSKISSWEVEPGNEARLRKEAAYHALCQAIKKKP